MNKEKVNGIFHLVAGLIILFHGFDSFEAVEFLPASTYFGLALLFLVVAGMHKYIVRRFETGDSAFFLLEAIAILYSGWHYKNLDFNFAFYFLTLLGIIYLLFAVLNINNADKPRRRRRRHKRRRSSQSLFDEDVAKPKDAGGDLSNSL